MAATAAVVVMVAAAAVAVYVPLPAVLVVVVVAAAALDTGYTGFCHFIGSISSDVIGWTRSNRFLSIQKATLYLPMLVTGYS